MSWMRWALAAAATACTGLAAPASAEPVGWRYEIMWGGFHAGDMSITRDDTAPQVLTRLSMRTAGLFKLLLPFDFDAEGASRRQGQSDLVSGHYQTRFISRYEDRVLRTEYGPAGEARVVRDETLAVFKPSPPDDMPNPPVPMEFRMGVMDPLTNMALAGRRTVEAAARGESSASFRNVSFDGRRAYVLESRLVGPRRIAMRDQSHDTVLVSMTLRPLAGFKEKFVKLWEGADYEVDVDPATMLPLRIRSESFAALTVFNALAPCRVPADKCMSPAE